MGQPTRSDRHQENLYGTPQPVGAFPAPRPMKRWPTHVRALIHPQRHPCRISVMPQHVSDSVAPKVFHPDQPVVRGGGGTGLDRGEQRPGQRAPRPAYPRGADPGPGVALGDPQHLGQTPVQRAVTPAALRERPGCAACPGLARLSAPPSAGVRRGVARDLRRAARTVRDGLRRHAAVRARGRHPQRGRRRWDSYRQTAPGTGRYSVAQDFSIMPTSLPPPEHSRPIVANPSRS